MLHLEHVGIAVPDDEDVVRLFEKLLGREIYKVEQVEADHVATYFIDAGSSKIELVSPNAAASPIARFLDRRGPGLHHLAFEVADIEHTFATVEKDGFRLASSEIMDGADGKRVFFLHPASTGGVLIEFCQRSRRQGAVSRLELGDSIYTSRQAGRGDAEALVVIAADAEAAGIEPLVAAFESTNRVLVLAPEDRTSAPSFDDLERAGFVTRQVVGFGGIGWRFIEHWPARDDRASVLFNPPDDTLRSSLIPRGLLLVTDGGQVSTEGSVRISAEAARRSIVVPSNLTRDTTDLVEAALPVIRRHLAR